MVVARLTYRVERVSVFIRVPASGSVRIKKASVSHVSFAPAGPAESTISRSHHPEVKASPKRIMRRCATAAHHPGDRRCIVAYLN